MRSLLAIALAVWPAAAEPLLVAARSDDLAGVESLLRKNVDVNAREDDGTTALAWAAHRGNARMAELLLAKGANPNLPSEMGISPLLLAITNGSAEIAGMLLAKGADPNLARESGEAPLMAAARLGQVSTVKLLLERGANPNAEDRKFEQTALMWAAGSPEIVRLLLDHGADPKAVTKTWHVKYTIYIPTTVTLGKTGIPWNNDGQYTSPKGGLNALFFAVQKHDLESARMLLDRGSDPNQPSADGSTPLLAALYNWDAPKETFVPGRGAPAAAGSSQRFRADLAMARLLLDRGAKAVAADGAGYTPLHGAALAVANAALGLEFRRGGAYGGKAALLSIGRADGVAPKSDIEDGLAIVRRLLDDGADPNRQTLYPTAGPAGDVRINPAPPGSSPFHIAASSRSLALLKFLADRGGNPNQLRKDGHTPFSVAVMAGDRAAAEELLVRGADLTMLYSPTEKIPDPVEPITLPRQNQSIMHIAALGGSRDVIEFLFAKGARLDLKNSAGETPADLADHQERYGEAIERQGAEGDPEKLAKIKRRTTVTDAFRKLTPAN
jgi:ankyrin repeat protein